MLYFFFRNSLHLNLFYSMKISKLLGSITAAKVLAVSTNPALQLLLDPYKKRPS